MARIGLIAGNGRFPFLALQGARSLGHDVTVVAVKEEAFSEPSCRSSARKAVMRRTQSAITRADCDVHSIASRARLLSTIPSPLGVGRDPFLDR